MARDAALDELIDQAEPFLAAGDGIDALAILKPVAKDRLARRLLGPQSDQTATRSGNVAGNRRWIAGHRWHRLTRDQTRLND